MAGKTEYNPLEAAEKIRKSLSSGTWRNRLVAAAIAAYGFLSGSSLKAENIGEEAHKDSTELRDESEETLNEEKICKAFNENPEEARQKFCENMADNICQRMIKLSDKRIAAIKLSKGAQKTEEIRNIFKEVTGRPSRASYCLAGLMSNFMKASGLEGYPELNDNLPTSKTYCSDFMKDSKVKDCSKLIKNDAKTIANHVGAQKGKIFLLFLPRNGGSGFHATMIKVNKNGEATLNAYNREYVGTSLSSLVNASRKQVGTKRKAVLVDWEQYVKTSLEHEMKEKCQTPETFLAYVTKGNTLEKVVGMLGLSNKTKKTLDFGEAIALFSEKEVKRKIDEMRKKITDNVKKTMEETELLASTTISPKKEKRSKGNNGVADIIRLRRGKVQG